MSAAHYFVENCYQDLRVVKDGFFKGNELILGLLAEIRRRTHYQNEDRSNLGKPILVNFLRLCFSLYDSSA